MSKYKNLHPIHPAEITTTTKAKRRVDAWGIEISNNMSKYKNLHPIHPAEIVTTTKTKRRVDAWGIEIKKPIAPKYCTKHKAFYPEAIKEKYGGCYHCYLEKKTKGLDPLPSV